MNEEERETIEETFTSISPYLGHPSDLEESIKETSDASENLKEFVEKFEKLISEEKDPTRKADGRIFLNKLRSR